MIQIPHHGSWENHQPTFWNKIISNKCQAAISCGINDSFQLPDYEVVKYFFSKKFIVRGTNNVYGLKDYLDEFNEKLEYYDTLKDEDSILTKEGDSRDLTYVLEGNSISLL